MSTKEQLSVIIRLDKKDDIVERFLKFYNMSTDGAAPAINSIVKDAFTHYGDSIQNKLIMQTYHGVSVKSRHILVSKPLSMKIIPLIASFTVQLTAYIYLYVSLPLLLSWLESSQMWLLLAHLLATVLEGRICCIQIKLIYLSLEKLGSTTVHVPSVFFMISTKPF